MGKRKMGSNVWYLTENDRKNSSYTDFTYTDFTQASNDRPVSRRTGNNPPSGKVHVQKGRAQRFSAQKIPAQKIVKPASVQVVQVKAKKKRAAGKVIFGIVGALAIGVVLFLIKDDVVAACDEFMNGDNPVAAAAAAVTGASDEKVHKAKRKYEKVDQDSDEFTVDTSDPAYGVAQSILASLQCDNDIDTAWEIFNWVHSNIYYQPILTSMTYEEAAYRGFTRKSGDCYVSFACAKMLLDCAGIPNMKIERYPVVTDAHYWNLVQLDGEWYHCDATVFKDHPEMYFMCTDDEICDSHHSFDGSLYPERASWGFDGGWDYSGDWYDGDFYDGGWDDDGLYPEDWNDEDVWYGDDSWYENDSWYGEDNRYDGFDQPYIGPGVYDPRFEDEYEYDYPVGYGVQPGEAVVVWED